MRTRVPRSCSYAARLPPSLTPSLPPARRSSSRPASDRDPNPNFSGLAGALAERASAAADPNSAAQLGALSALAPRAAERAGGLAACGSPVLQAWSADAPAREPSKAGPLVAGARAAPEPAAQVTASLVAGGGMHSGGSDGMLHGAQTNTCKSVPNHKPVRTVQRSCRSQDSCNARMHSCETPAQHMYAWRITDTPRTRDLEVESVFPCLQRWQIRHACVWLHGEHQTHAGSGHVMEGAGGSASGVGYSFLCLRYACARDSGSGWRWQLPRMSPCFNKALCLATFAAVPEAHQSCMAHQHTLDQACGPCLNSKQYYEGFQETGSRQGWCRASSRVLSAALYTSASGAGARSKPRSMAFRQPSTLTPKRIACRAGPPQP